MSEPPRTPTKAGTASAAATPGYSAAATPDINECQPEDVETESWERDRGKQVPGEKDLLKDRLQARERDTEELGLVELRAELDKLRAERDTERRNMANAVGSGHDHGLMGPLNETQLVKYMMQLDSFGREAVYTRLMETPLQGGLSLDRTSAMRAVEQLELVLRLSLVRNTGSTTAPEPPPPEEQTLASQIAVVAEKRNSVTGRPALVGKGLAPAVPKETAPASGGGKAAKKGGKPGKGAAGVEPPQAKVPSTGPGPPAKGGKAGKGMPPPKAPDAPGAKSKAPMPPKGKGPSSANSVQPTKPAIKPGKPMKPLWWNRLIFGAQIEKGKTIWDSVTDEQIALPIEEIEERYSKSANAAGAKGEGGQNAPAEKAKVKLLRIITDSKVAMKKEMVLKQLPPAQEIARALFELDDQTLTIEFLSVVRDAACPNAAEVHMMTEARQKEPGVPWAFPEQYMWVVSKLPAYQQRMDCWYFIRTYKEAQVQYKEALNEFTVVVEAILGSKSLPSLLSLILAIGNYLNGGTNRGQADGFDLETLGKLESIKDPSGKDIRHFIWELYFSQFVEQAPTFVEELKPLWASVGRHLSRDQDGAEKIEKSCKVYLEFYESSVNDLQKEYIEKYEHMQIILQYAEDAADPFKLRMPTEFAQAKENIDEVVKLKDTAKDKYSRLLTWFRVPIMKSTDLFLLWDNLLVPPELIISRDVGLKKEILAPAFLRNRAFTFNELLVLWDFRKPGADTGAADDAPEKKGRRHGGGKRCRFSVGARSGGENAPAKSPDGQVSPEKAAPEKD